MMGKLALEWSPGIDAQREYLAGDLALLHDSLYSAPGTVEVNYQLYGYPQNFFATIQKLAAGFAIDKYFINISNTRVTIDAEGTRPDEEFYVPDKDVKLSTRELAKIVNRGGTSGIGVASFDEGGFILDGGHSFGPGKETESFLPSAVSTASPPPVIFRYNQPLDWCFLILTPAKIKGLSGTKEIDSFQEHCPIPAEHAERLSRLILMKILPSIIEKDIKNLGEGITEMQTKFKRFGMDKYDNTIVTEVLYYLRNIDEIHGSGITSFGPTVFGLVDNKKSAKIIIDKIQENFNVKDFQILERG